MIQGILTYTRRPSTSHVLIRSLKHNSTAAAHDGEAGEKEVHGRAEIAMARERARAAGNAGTHKGSGKEREASHVKRRKASIRPPFLAYYFTELVRANRLLEALDVWSHRYGIGARTCWLCAYLEGRT